VKTATELIDRVTEGYDDDTVYIFKDRATRDKALQVARAVSDGYINDEGPRGILMGADSGEVLRVLKQWKSRGYQYRSMVHR